MANIYVRSTTGNDANDGLTWATAKATFAGAAAIDAAGDTIVLADDHNEATATAQTVTLAGTVAAPVKIVCGTTTAAPPTSSAISAKVTTTGGNTININGYGYIYGIEFAAGSGNSVANVGVNNSGNASQRYERCKFNLTNTSGSSKILLGNASSTAIYHVHLRDCDIKFGTAAQVFESNAAGVWEGGSVLAGTATPTTGAFSIGNRGGSLLVSGVDMSAFGTGVNLTKFGNGPGTITFRNCKLPAGWTGSLAGNAIPSPGCRVVMVNCDAGDTNYKMQVADYAGSVSVDTNTTRFSGATDGTTAISWKVTTNGGSVYPSIVLETEEIYRWFPDTDRGEALGSPITVGLEIIHDSAADLKNDEAWVVVQSLSTSGFPLGKFTSSRKAEFFAAGVNQPTSTALWSAPGMTTPRTQFLSVQVTPQEAGWLCLKAVVAKPSTTINVCPKVKVA